MKKEIRCRYFNVNYRRCIVFTSNKVKSTKGTFILVSFVTGIEVSVFLSRLIALLFDRKFKDDFT